MKTWTNLILSKAQFVCAHEAFFGNQFEQLMQKLLQKKYLRNGAGVIGGNDILSCLSHALERERNTL